MADALHGNMDVAEYKHVVLGLIFLKYSMLMLQEALRMYEHTATVFGAINKEQLRWLPMVVPPSNLVRAFESLASPLDDKIRSNIELTRILTVLRDTRLPRLVTGGVRVKHPYGEWKVARL